MHRPHRPPPPDTDFIDTPSPPDTQHHNIPNLASQEIYSCSQHVYYVHVHNSHPPWNRPMVHTHTTPVLRMALDLAVQSIWYHVNPQTLGSCLSIVPTASTHQCTPYMFSGCPWTVHTSNSSINDSLCDMTQGSLSWPRAPVPARSSSVHRQQPSHEQFCALHTRRTEASSCLLFMLFFSLLSAPPPTPKQRGVLLGSSPADGWLSLTLYWDNWRTFFMFRLPTPSWQLASAYSVQVSRLDVWLGRCASQQRLNNVPSMRYYCLCFSADPHAKRSKISQAFISMQITYVTIVKIPQNMNYRIMW